MEHEEKWNKNKNVTERIRSGLYDNRMIFIGFINIMLSYIIVPSKWTEYNLLKPRTCMKKSIMN